MKFTYKFSDITDNKAVCYVGQTADTATRVDHFVEDHFLSSFLGKTLPDYLADLIDLAVAVQIADRLSRRKIREICHIHIELPVRQPQKISGSNIVSYLEHLLCWFTGDSWSFYFTQYKSPGRFAELQPCLPIPSLLSKEATTVALFSGGLDSLAGLVDQLKQNPSSCFLLLGFGTNSQIRNAQKHSASKVAESFPHRTQLLQLSFGLLDARGLRKSKDQRSRGFIFLLLGSVVAFLAGQNELYIYENGIGAINLPFTKSEVGLDRSRAVNPLIDPYE